MKDTPPPTLVLFTAHLGCAFHFQEPFTLLYIYICEPINSEGNSQDGVRTPCTTVLVKQIDWTMSDEEQVKELVLFHQECTPFSEQTRGRCDA